MQYHDSHGRIVLNAEAAEVCAKCEGEGTIATMNGVSVICDACGGRLGPISNLTPLRLNGTEFLLIRRGDFSGHLLGFNLPSRIHSRNAFLAQPGKKHPDRGHMLLNSCRRARVLFDDAATVIGSISSRPRKEAAALTPIQ
jgi:hypothetical protein